MKKDRNSHVSKRDVTKRKNCQGKLLVSRKATMAGITLVTLVVTIVVLLILAGITIVYVFGDNGVFGKALDAKVATELGKIEEQAGIIYADKFLESQGEAVANREIIDELINKGNNIEIRYVGSAAVTEISLEPAEVSIDKSKSATIKVKFEGSEDGNLYYAVIDGKYYKINFQGSPLTIEREDTTPEGNVAESASIEVVSGYDITIVTKAEINQDAKTIEIGSGTTYGETTITVKYGSNTADCKVTVEEAESNWAEIAEMAKQIANNSSITSDSDQAIATINGESKTIKVGDIYKVKYNGEIRRVRVLGFKHDDLVDQGVYKDGKQHEKAGISFEFLDFMTGTNYMTMNDNYKDTKNWAVSRMRLDLNGDESNIGGLGANLSNKAFVKQVKKKYIAIYNQADSVLTCNDFLWLLASSEIVPRNSDSTRYGLSIASEGEQYRFYQGISEVWNEPSPFRVKKSSVDGYATYWNLRSTQANYQYFFSRIKADGNLNPGKDYNGNDKHGVAPGFAI